MKLNVDKCTMIIFTRKEKEQSVVSYSLQNIILEWVTFMKDLEVN